MVDVSLEEEEPHDSELPDSGTSGQAVESSTTGATSVSNGSGAEHITECATAWSVVSFVISSLYTAIHVVFALTGELIYTEFYAYVLLPTCVTSLIIAFALKPRRNDLAYMAFLSFQYVAFSIGVEVLSMKGYKWDKDQMRVGFVRGLVWLILFLVALKFRFSIARLSDADLSKFLSMSVIKGGLMVGIGQLVFLAFSSIQCVNESSVEGDVWRECTRSLYSQTGLGGLVGLYTVIEMLSGVAPRKYIDRHIIKPKKIATMDLNVKEVSTLMRYIL